MYPIFLNVSQMPCIVIGAGCIAQRRIATLLAERADVTVVAPESLPAALHNKPLRYLQANYTAALLHGYRLVFAATDDAALNATIVQDAQAQGLWVSSVTESEQEDFSVPAQVSAGALTAAVSTHQQSPSLAAAICREIQPTLAAYAGLCPLQAQLRQHWKATVPDRKQRHKMLQTLSSPDLLSCYREQGAAGYLEKVHAPAPTEKAAILMVSFGTSYENTREKTIGAVEQAVREAFPDCDVFRAFTSNMIMQKMRKEGIAIDTVSEALLRLQKMGYQTVYCQPTHIMGGIEYDRFCAAVQPFASSFSTCKIGKPLLYEIADFPALIAALQAAMTRSTDTAYLWMGHGTAHTANMVYPTFDYCLKRAGYPNAFVGTVEGYPTFETVLEQLEEGHYKHVVLLPMMLVAGDHVQNDMAGKQADSWEQILKQKGYHVTVNLQGLGEYPTVQQLYVQRVRETMVS
jgi:sirohydrochlorin cobaltochelatase